VTGRRRKSGDHRLCRAGEQDAAGVRQSEFDRTGRRCRHDPQLQRPRVRQVQRLRLLSAVPYVLPTDTGTPERKQIFP